MEYRTLGQSGCSVSSLALGTMTFGSETDEEGSFAQLDAFVAAGGTLVDTADVYSGGTSEEIIGRWFSDRPADVTESVVLATKGRFPTSAEPNGVGLSRRHLTNALDASLRRLGRDSVDLYQVHAWDPYTPIAETLDTGGFVVTAAPSATSNRVTGDGTQMIEPPTLGTLRLMSHPKTVIALAAGRVLGATIPSYSLIPDLPVLAGTGAELTAQGNALIDRLCVEMNAIDPDPTYSVRR